ncbi:MAG: hypothetical protein Q8O76_07585, partial [Chloroflexota bacterium]|nr:hypothetical protein [Chloroflexota bacterium]
EGLRLIMRLLNEDARLATPTMLERCMANVLDGPGADWLLDAAQAWGLADAEEVQRNVAACQPLLDSEAGRKAIVDELQRRRPELQAWRRKMVAHARVWEPGGTGMEFRAEALPESGDIYAMLTKEPMTGGAG